MMWKDRLRELEKNKKWDEAIEFMQDIVLKNQNSVDAYLSINYLLMNLVVEEDYNADKVGYYLELLLKYFNESYKKFSDNPEYLFFIARIAFMSVWNFNIECEDAANMLKRALLLDSHNFLYQWSNYSGLSTDNLQDRKKALPYAKKVLENEPLLQSMLSSKGSLGEFILGMMINWSKRIVAST